MKHLSIAGILAAVLCLFIATQMLPGGFDWSRDFVSTLLRSPSVSVRLPGIAGLLIFCVSVALVFTRLANAHEFSKHAKLIRIAGIGSMVYASLAFTPLHDMVVAIAILFFLAAVIPLVRTLSLRREKGLFLFGCVCLVVLTVSATIYYARLYALAWPWAQRATFAVFTVWLVSLDH